MAVLSGPEFCSTTQTLDLHITVRQGSNVWVDWLYPNSTEAISESVSQVPTYIVGTAVFSGQNEAVEDLTPATTSSKHMGTSVLLFPGLWFTEQGFIQNWAFEIIPVKSARQVHLQVYRPSCTSGNHLLHPGCQKSSSPYSVCTSSVPVCNQQQANCNVSMQYCPISGVCQSILEPCTCNGDASINHCQQGTTVGDNNNIPQYTLVNSIVVNIKASQTRILYHVEDSSFKVQPFDVVGVQYDSKDTILQCIANSNSIWKQRMLMWTKKDWITVGKTMNSNSAKKKDNVVCHIRALYTKPITVKVPENLTKTDPVLSPGSYHFTATVRNDVDSVTLTKTVTVMESVQDLELVHPVTQGTKNNTVVVEVGVPTFFLVKISQGGHAFANWTINNVQTIFSTNCPRTVQHLPQCQNHSSGESFASALYQFNNSGHRQLGIVAKNAVSEQKITVYVDSYIRIDGLQMKSNRNGVVEVNKTEILLAIVSQGTGVLYNWNISDGTVIITNETSIKHTFQSTGSYNVKLTASNPLGSVTIIKTLQAHHRAYPRNLSIKMPSVAGQGDSVTAVVSLNMVSLTQVNATWNWGRSTTKKGMYKMPEGQTFVQRSLKNAFDQTGNFTFHISLSDAFEVISANRTIEIIQKIAQVSLHMPPGIVVTNDTVFFTVQSNSSVSPVMYEWYVNGNNMSATSNATWQYTFMKPGKYIVTVIAKNQVSSASSSLSLTVEEPITGLHLSYNGTAFAGVSFTMTAKISTGSNVNFVFDTNIIRSNQIAQSNNELHYIFTNPGQYNITVTAMNRISQQFAWMLLVVRDASSLFIREIITADCTAAKQPVPMTVSLLHHDQSSLLFNWHFGDGNTNSQSGKGLVTVSHTYSKIGSYNISIDVSDSSGQNHSIFKTICVQEPVSGVILRSNSPRPLVAGRSTTVEFQVQVQQGSDYSYIWRYNGKEKISQPGDPFKMQFTSPGMNTFHLTVQNSLNSVNTSTTVIIQEIITGLLLQTPAHFLAKDKAYTFKCSIGTGSSVNYSWLFNDTAVTKPSNKPSQVYSFAQVGMYIITVHASNLISEQDKTVTIFVHVPVSSLRITSNATSVKLGDTVEFTASAQSGTSITYNWIICLKLCTAIPSAIEKLIHKFDAAGKYTINVTASNELNGVSGQLVVSVIEAIQGLAISMTNLTSDKYYARYQVLHLSGTVEEGTNVSYLWTITSSGASPFTVAGKVADFSCNDLGIYEIVLKASNSWGSSQIDRTFEVVEKVLGLYIVTNSTAIVLGKNATFEARITGGSQVNYKWDLIHGDMVSSVQEGAASSLVHMFKQPGDYILRVTAINPLQQTSARVLLKVQETIQGAQLLVHSAMIPYVPKAEPLVFQAKFTKGTHLQYEWIFPNLKLKGNATVKYSFTNLGTYKVKLRVSNDVSAVELEKQLTVEEELSNFKVQLDRMYGATGSKVTFTTMFTHGSNITYSWNFGDGTLQSTLDSQVHVTHAFFEPGLYNVSITASNHIGSSTKEVEVHVLDKVDGLNFVQCCDQFIPTNVAINLDVDIRSGTEVLYQWTVDDELLQTTSQKHFKHIFSKPKKYRIHVRASNAINSQDKEIYIGVEDPIQRVKLLPKQPYFVHQKFSLDTMIIGGSNIKYEWQINGQTVSDISTSSLVYIFSKGGTFKISVRAFNDISSVQDSAVVDVKRVDCVPPTVTPAGGKYREELRSRKLVLEVDVNLHGCTKYTVIHQWKINSRSCSDPLGKLLPVNVTTNGPVLNIPARYLRYGFYCVLFSTKLKGTPLEGKTKVQVKILPTPLKAIIKGGSVREFSREKQIMLDGTLSYDPDSERENTKHLSYEWTCSSIPKSLRTTDRCFSPKYTSTVTIPSYELLPNRTYTFRLTVKSPERGSTCSIQMVTIKSKTVPLASIECLSCSMSNVFVISSSLPIKLLGTCQNCGPARDQILYSYYWQAERDDGRRLELNDKSTTTLDNKPNLAVRRGALEGGHAYTFKLTVRDLQNWQHFGQSSLKLKAHTPPHSGHCSAAPATAVTMETKIAVECDGWNNTVNTNAPLIFHIFVERFTDHRKKKREWYTVYRGTQKRISFFLSPWGEHGNDWGQVTLNVSVQDQLGAETIGLGQKITLKAPKVPEGVTKTAYLLNLTRNVLPVLERQNNPRALILYAMALIMQLNIESKRLETGVYTHDKERDMRIQVRETVTSLMTKPKAVPLTSTDEIQQLSFLLKLATEYPKEFKTSTVYEDIMNTIDRTLVAIEPYVSQTMESEDFSPAYLMRTVENVIKSVKYHSSMMEEASSAGGSVQVVDDGIHEAFGRHAMHNWKPINRTMIVEMALHIADHIMVLILQTQIPDEAKKSFSSSKFLARGQRTRAAKIWTQQVSRNKCMFKIPAGLLQNHRGMEVFQVMTLMDSNPFTWGFVDGLQITSLVPSLTFKFTNGSTIILQDLPPEKKITVAMKTDIESKTLTLDNGDEDPEITGTSDAPITSTSGASLFFEELKVPYRPSADLPLFTVTMAPNDVKQTKLNTSIGIKHQATMQIQVLGLVLPGYNETSAEAQYDLSMMAYIGKGEIPTAATHFLALNITSQTMSRGADHRNYTFFIQDAFDGAEEYFITVVNMDSQHSVNVSVGVYFSMCQFYNEKINKWDASGCVASNLCLASITVCECNHLTSFGASVLVQPSDVNFDDFKRLDIAKNPVAVITVCVLAFLYLVLVILARHWDIQDLQRIGTVPLCGKNGHFKYEVTVVTGMQAGAGTTANVGIKLYGDLGKSGARHLSKPGAFERNSYDVLLVATETSLGDLQRVHIWHDNSGLDPSWYLSRVLVRDLQTDKKYYFLAECWFSVMSDKGFLEKDLMVTGGAELKRFKRKFKEETYKGLCEKHVWLSVVEHTAQSRFTRVQRVTCCFTLLYTFMCVNAMWYGVIQAPTIKELTLGTSTLSWKDIIVGLVTSLVVFPINFAIMQIFRKSRTQVDPYAYSHKLQASQTIEMDAMCDMSRGGSSFGSLGMPPLEREDTTESMQDNRGWWSYDSILNWPEKMPAWNEEQDSRQSSANPIRRRPTYYPVRGQPGKARRESYDSWLSDEDWLTNDCPQNKVRGVLKRRMSRKISISESIDERLDDSLQTNKNMDASNSKEQVTENIPLETLVNEKSPPRRTGRKASDDSGRSRSVSFSDESTRSRPLSLRSRSSSLSSEGKARAEPGVLETAIDEKPADLKEKTNPREEAKLMTTEANASRPPAEPLHPAARRYSLANSLGTADSTKEFESEEGMSIMQAPSYLMHSEKSFTDYSTCTGRSHVQSIPPPPMTERFLLPHWCIYVAYVLCVILNAFSIILVILYGHKFGKQVALRWLLALTFSLFESVFVLEPLKVLLLALIIAALATHMEGLDEGGNVELAPLVEAHEKIKDVHMKPLGGYALLQAREEGHRVYRMQSLMRHTVIYGIYFLVVLAISYSSHQDNAFHMTKTVKGTFVHQTWGTSPVTFGGINKMSGWWDWMDQVVAPGLYKGTTELNVTQPYLLGVARLRQIRSLTEPCPARHHLVHAASAYRLGANCFGDPGWAEDTGNYGVAWNKSTPENETVWDYQTAQDLDGQGWQGSVAWYSGGGYTVSLGHSQADTIDILKKLKHNNWIDRGTRAVFVEFTLYNFNVNQSSVVSLLMELPISGGVLTSHYVSTIQLMRFVPGSVDILLICKPLLLLVLLFLVGSIILGLWQQKLHYFTQSWNLCLLALTGLTTATLALYVHTVIQHTNTYERLVQDLTTFTNFTMSAHWYHTWQCVNAALVFLLTIMVAHQLRFIKFMSVYWRTLREAASHLVGSTLLYFLVVILFAQLFYLWYGGNLGRFSSLGTAIVTLHGLLRGRTDFTAPLQYNRSFTIIFMTTFVVVIMIGVSGLILAVLTHTYKMVRSQMFYHNTLEMQDYEMIEFMIKRFKRWAGITKPKPAFRKVKFQGMPSVSTRSTYSSHSSRVSSGSTDQSGSLMDELGEQVDQLLARAESTWQHMLNKLDQVARQDEEEQNLIDKLEQQMKPEELEKQNMNKTPEKNMVKSKGLGVSRQGPLKGGKAPQPQRIARTHGAVLPSVVGQARRSGSGKSKAAGTINSRPPLPRQSKAPPTARRSSELSFTRNDTASLSDILVTDQAKAHTQGHKTKDIAPTKTGDRT